MRHHRHRQERWLHTRISEDLEEALKREARRRRSPVSLVVRNVLESALDLVEDIVEDSLEVGRRARRLARNVRHGQPTKADSNRVDDIYGWQELVLNRATQCMRCTTGLAAGAKAYRGLRDAPAGAPVFLCTTCVRRLHQPAPAIEEEPQ